MGVAGTVSIGEYVVTEVPGCRGLREQQVVGQLRRGCQPLLQTDCAAVGHQVLDPDDDADNGQCGGDSDEPDEEPLAQRQVLQVHGCRVPGTSRDRRYLTGISTLGE